MGIYTNWAVGYGFRVDPARLEEYEDYAEDPWNAISGYLLNYPRLAFIEASAYDTEPQFAVCVSSTINAGGRGNGVFGISLLTKITGMSEEEMAELTRAYVQVGVGEAGIVLGVGQS